MWEKRYRDKIVTIKEQQATDETNRAGRHGKPPEDRADAAKGLQKVTPRTSPSTDLPVDLDGAGVIGSEVDVLNRHKLSRRLPAHGGQR